MNPKPFDASNHLMTPEISTRLAAVSPRPDSASRAGSRALENSPGPSLFDPAPPGGEPPSFLDSNPSDPMTPDPTHHLWPVVSSDGTCTRPSMTIHDDITRESLESKDNTPGCRA